MSQGVRCIVMMLVVLAAGWVKGRGGPQPDAQRKRVRAIPSWDGDGDGGFDVGRYLDAPRPTS